MPRAIELAARFSPTRIDVAMRTRIPAIDGHVDAAADGQRVVDDDDLLMMRRTDRMGAVELES